MKVIDRSKYMEEGIVLPAFDRVRQGSDGTCHEAMTWRKLVLTVNDRRR